MVPLTGQNTVNDMVDRINEVSQEIQDIAFVNANAVLGPASSSADQIMAFSDTTGKRAKAANISSFAYSILDDADDAAARATLGLKSAAVLDAATAATPNTAVQRDASGNITGVGITASSGFVGNGSQITSLDMNNAASGTLAVARGGTGTTTSTGTGSVVRSASPTFTGTPLSTTASADTNTTQIATTAYVIGQASSTAPLMDGVAAAGTSLRYARADHVHPSDTTKVNTSLLGVANGVATLDSAGKVPTSQLPAYVDDVLEYANLASFPATGETGKIYVALDTNKTYRWSGSAYIYITSGAVDSVAGKTGVVTLVKGDVGLGNVDNTSDVNKPVSTAQQNALNLKANLASPVLTGAPTAPTAAVGTNTTQLATTAFVNAEIANDAPSKTGVGASGSWGISVTGNAATATKLATARTISVSGAAVGFVNFDGSSNVEVVTKTPRVTPATDPTSTFRADVFGGHDDKIKVLRVDATGYPNFPQHAPCLAWSVYDAHAFFSPSFSTPKIRVGAGAGTGIAWEKDLAFTDSNITGNAATATKLATARTINGVAFDGSANITVADSTKLPLAGGNMTGDLTYQNVGVGEWARGLTAKIQASGAFAGGIGFYGSGDSVYAAYLGIGPDYWASGNGVRVTAAGVTISGATTFDTLITGSVNGNAGTATKLAAGRTIGMTGDVTWTSPAFDGSGNITAVATLANTGVAAGTYGKVTVNAKGLVTAGAALAAADIPALDAGKITSGTFAAARIPTLNQNTKGSAATLTTARTLTVGKTGKTFNGSANVAWSLAEIGAAPATHSHSEYLPFAGGVMTGPLATHVAGHPVGEASGDAAFSVRGDANSAAVMSFHRPGAYGLNMGLDTDTVFRLGGWTDGANTYRFTADQSGNFWARGNITAYSDIRLKTDIEVIPDALAKVEQLRGVTYKRIDSGERQTGLIAQEVQKVLPEAVSGDDMLSVAYGNLVGLLVEAIKELKAEVEELKLKVGA